MDRIASPGNAVGGFSRQIWFFPDESPLHKSATEEFSMFSARQFSLPAQLQAARVKPALQQQH
jgi:hypothetical protein